MLHRAASILLRRAPILTLLLMLGPVAAGLLGTILPALGYLPALGAQDLGVAIYAALLEWPGLPRAVWLSISTGLAATLISLVAVMLIVAGWHGTRSFGVLERALSPLLSVPHAAAAFGLAFLIAPSGWVARLFSPWATGWTRPPDLLILQDPAGITLIAGLVAKEIPFLLLMTLAALPQSNPRRAMLVARTLGYTQINGWFLTVFPAIYRQIRLPVYAVLAFSMSVVDVALILGPSTPPTLAVQVVKWMNDPDLTLRLQAAAGACLQLGLVIVMLVLWRVGESIVAAAGRHWILHGNRGAPIVNGVLRLSGLSVAALSGLAVFFGLVGLLVWSFAGLWQFPDLMPRAFTLRSWDRHGAGMLDPFWETVLIGLASTVLGLFLVIACLEAEHRHGLRPGARALWLLYLPLIVPQVAFLGGLQTLAIGSGLDGGRIAVILAHLVFVLPYVFLSLADPWRNWDTRVDTVARALGANPWRVLWCLRLPMLLRPLLTAAAVGFAVSVGQYLPTLLVGGGRIQTLTTEALALSSGGDRRVIGIYALAQTAVAFAPFGLALLLPKVLWRDRRGMTHG